VACPDCPLTENSLKEVCRGLSDLSTMSNRCTLIEVERQPFWMGFFYLAWGKQPKLPA
jgi:hypothetical protein